MKKTLLMAHRGFSGRFPENTRRAFMEAIALGRCDGFESDVHLSADGEPVVIHDAVLERTTNGKGLVRNLTFGQLRELDTGSWFDPLFKDERMMHLDELLALIAEHDMVLNLELKNGEIPYPGLEQIVIEHIHRMKAENRVFLSSFNHISMKQCKAIDADIQTGLLYSYPLLEAEKYAVAHGVDALHPRYSCFGFETDLVERSHQADLKVNTWTVNEVEDMRFCIRLGVDSIISNYPDVLADVMKEEEKDSAGID